MCTQFHSKLSLRGSAAWAYPLRQSEVNVRNSGSQLLSDKSTHVFSKAAVDAIRCVMPRM
jgi:hypothetical protein